MSWLTDWLTDWLNIAQAKRAGRLTWNLERLLLLWCRRPLRKDFSKRAPQTGQNPKMCFSVFVDIFKTTRDINMKPTPYDRGAKIRGHVFHRFSIQVAVSEKLNEKGFESIKCFFLSFFFIWRLALITSVSRINIFQLFFQSNIFFQNNIFFSRGVQGQSSWLDGELSEAKQSG